MSKGTQTIELSLEDGTDLTFTIKREDYIRFVNGALKNPHNAQHNLLAATVDPEQKATLTEMLENPANVTELAAALLEDYKPDIAVVAKKRRA